MDSGTQDSGTQDRLIVHLLEVTDHLLTSLEVSDLADRLMTSCLEILPAVSVGILIADADGQLRVLASSSDEALDLELLEIQNREGPCLQALGSGEVVAVPNLAGQVERWPTFAPAALARGFTGACAVPLTLSERTIGTLNLFLDGDADLSRRQLQIAHVLARLATVGIINHHTSREQEQLAEQLRTALESRVTIEQAKGIVAARAGTSVGRAFELLRSAARASQRPLVEVAADVISGRLPPTRLAPSGLRRTSQGRPTVDGQDGRRKGTTGPPSVGPSEVRSSQVRASEAGP